MSTVGYGPKVLMSAAVLAVLLGMTGVSCRADEVSTKLYKAKCAACHGPDGKGETPIGKAGKLRDLGSAEVAKQSDEDLAEIISNGKNKMPGFGKTLKPEQIKDLVAYIRGFSKKS